MAGAATSAAARAAAAAAATISAAATMPAIPQQEAGQLPYEPPDCSGAKDSLRNRVLEQQEAVVACLAAVRT